MPNIVLDTGIEQGIRDTISCTHEAYNLEGEKENDK